MPDLLTLPGALTVPETALLLLSAVILALFVATLLFSGYTVMLRARHDRRDRLWARLTGLWEGHVLAAIMDPAAIDAARAAVPDRYRLFFVQYVLEYSRRLRGEERRTLRRLVEPYLPLVAERVGHRRSEVRTRAIQTLGTLGLPQHAAEVVAALDDPSPLVSMIAARSLARRDFPQYAPQVMKHLHRFEGWNHRFLASMLAAIGPEVSETLRRGLADESSPSWLRAVHAEALRMQLDPMSGDVALEALREAEDRELLAACLRLLATVGRPHHLAEVRRFRDAGDPIVRAQALHALGQLGSEDELPLLLDAIDDPSPWVALHAARGAREAGGGRLLRKLAEADGPRARLAGQVLDEEDEP